MFQLLKQRSFGALTLTQFLGAFNDNAFKQLVLLLALSSAVPWVAEVSWAGEYGQALGSALFSLPFVLFGALTGSLADRFSKRSVMVCANACEVGVMGLGALAFYLESFSAVLAVLFLMGAQSSLFGPSKYGSIPELTERRDLSRANALIQMTTFVAIVCGTGLGSWLFEAFSGRLWIPSVLYITLSSTGFLASLFIVEQPASAPERPLDWNAGRVFWRQWSVIRGDRALVLALIASAFFFLIGATLLLVVNQYGKWLGLGGGAIGLLLTLLSLGIAAGSLLAARLSGDQIESGLIPAGLFGVSLSTFLVLVFPDSTNWLRACLFLAGVSAGLFSVPIRALIQHLPRASDRGSVLGFSEVADFIGVFLASGLFFFLGSVLNLDPPGMLATIGVMALCFTVGSFFYTAEFTLRFWLTVVFHSLYRFRIRGSEHIPGHGGALLVSNHLSFVDAFLVAAAVGRPLHFMMYRRFFDVPIVGLFSKLMGAIPVAPEDGRAAKVEALERAAELLRQGELVCIFAEGSVSRSGSLMPFRRGLERIAKRAGTPIIPVALDGLWGSIFSFEGGRFFWKLPRKLPWPVDVLFGPALPPDTRASEVRAVVEELITTARSDMRGEADTLGGRYLRAARKYAGRTALVDSSGARLTHRRLLVSVLALCRECRRRFSPGERVGVLLPPGAPAVQVTLALTLAGQVPIHLNYSLGAQELSHPIQRAGLQRIVSAPRFLAVLGIEEPPWEVDVLDLEQFAGAISARDKLAAVLASALPGGLLARLWRPAIDPSATATILFSSGSTGAPKGVVLSHANLLSNVIAISQVLALGEEDRILGVLPFFHSFGLTATLWVPLLQGATAVYHNRPTDGARIAKLCETEGVTVALATPTLYQAWMRRAAPEQLGRLRLAIVGAEKLRGALATAFEERYGLPLLEGYGCTELSPVVCMNLPDSDREVPGHERVHRPGTVGRALPGVCLRTVDPKTHAVLEPGAEGLLFVRGPNVMQGYLDDPEATAKVMHGKWYDTGDIGRVDRDSFLVLTDRLSRFAKIGGEMVPQGRVEEALAEVCSRLMEGAAGIEAAMPDFAVCAVPDEKKGERLVVLHTTLGFNPEDWCAGLAKAGLPAIFLPRADQYFEVPEIPRLGTGKLDLGRLKALARELSS